MKSGRNHIEERIFKSGEPPTPLWNTIMEQIRTFNCFFKPFKTRRTYIERRNRISTVCYQEIGGVGNLLSLSHLSCPLPASPKLNLSCQSASLLYPAKYSCYSLYSIHCTLLFQNTGPLSLDFLTHTHVWASALFFPGNFLGLHTLCGLHCFPLSL